MMKVLITGRSGVGKSTVTRELAKRGHTAYDTDDMPDVSRLEIKATGEPTEWPTGFIDWDHYAWRWQKDAIEKLLNGHEDVIIGAVMSNQKDFYHLFDLIIVLTISSETLRHRLETRTAHTYGQDMRNIERSVEKHERRQADLLGGGTVGVDNSRPTSVVVDEIEKIIDEHRHVAQS